MRRLTHIECREARRRLGLSTAKMARALGLADGRSIRRLEADPARVTRALSPTHALGVLYRLILAGRVTRADLEAVSEGGET